MRTHRGSPLWIVGRLGILIVFGIMPIMRACDRNLLQEASTKAHAAYEEAMKCPVSSKAWNSNVAVHEYWTKEAERLYDKMYGKQTNQPPK